MWRETHELANRSMLFVAVVMGLTGDIMVTQAATQAQRIVGDLGLVGPAFLQLLVREFAPVIVALMVAARYGAGVAAQIATMQVTEQVDALRLAGIDEVEHLVSPRLIAGLCGMLPVVVLGGAVAYAAGAVAAHVRFDVGWHSYFNLRGLTGADVVVGVAKAVAFGLAVPLVAAFVGMQARGGAPAVGAATTRAVVGASMAVLALDLGVGIVGYLVSGLV